MRKWVIRLLVMQIIVWGVIPLALIASQWPKQLDAPKTLDFSSVAKPISGTPQALTSYVARDGTKLAVRDYGAKQDGEPLAIVIHGSGWHSLGYTPLAQAISDQTSAHVLAPDLRGHGFSPKRRGDVEYTGQLEDDLADLIKAKRQPGQKVVLIGHSSGGGLIIRLAGGKHRELFDQAVLIAPFLKYNAPTMRNKAGGWAHVLMRRMVGLSMQDMVGVTALHGMTAIQFNFPQAVLDSPLGHTATNAYSFRMNQSYSPRSDYLADISKLPPFLLLVGSEEDAFLPEQFEPTMSAASNKGSYHIIDGASHIGILTDQRALTRIASFIASAKP